MSGKIYVRTNPDEPSAFLNTILNRDELVFPRPDVLVNDLTRGIWVTKFPFGVKKVIFNPPATIVFWTDGVKTVVKCAEGDVFDEEKGIALCFMKRAMGNEGNYNNVFKKWVPEPKSDLVDSIKSYFTTLGESIKSGLANMQH